MDNRDFYKLSSSSDDKMTAKREIFCAQLLGVFWLIVGVVGGLLIGIYLYHGGPDGEVTCKNLPEPQNQEAMTTERQVTTTPQTKLTTKLTTPWTGNGTKPWNGNGTMSWTGDVTTKLTLQLTTELIRNSTSPDNAESQTFTYTLQNGMHEPYFDANIELPITTGKRLIDYMQVACNMNSVMFSGFTVTYFSPVEGGAGYLVNSINGVSGNWAQNKTYWEISNQDGVLNVGVSLYEPRPMDQILFNLTQYIGNH